MIDYEYCTGCHTCEVACRKSLGLNSGQFGIHILKDGPRQIEGTKKWELNYLPVPTSLCDLCAERTGKGKEPLCVHHCLANVLYYGPVEKLAKKLEDKPKQMLIVPQFMPREAKGEFVHVENELDHRKAAHIEVEGTGSSTFGAHRHDAKVGEYSEDAV